MNPLSKLASLFVVVSSLSFGQAVPAVGTTSVPASAPALTAPSSASVNPAATPALPASSQAPDLTFKPNPQEEPPPPAPPAVSPPTATPGSPDAAQKKASPASSGSAPASGNSATASGNKAATGTAAKPALADMPHYVLGANDVVGVTVFGESSVPGTYAIGPDGRISMPLIHDFTAIGLTIPELQELITEKLSAFVIDPVVNVQLLRNNSKKYTLIGGVGKPGPYPLLQETTILDALAASGGFREFANQKDIILRRGTKEFHFNYKEVVKGKHLLQNINLEDGDIIVVKE
jgi:polysaccharide export outer membrane protein